jgi:hypothetical protein
VAGLRRIAGKATAFYDFNIGQESGQGTRSGGLGGATFATDKHASDAWVYGVEDERAEHGLLANDSGEWVDTGMVHSLSFARQDYSTAAVFFNNGWMVFVFAVALEHRSGMLRVVSVFLWLRLKTPTLLAEASRQGRKSENT